MTAVTDDEQGLRDEIADLERRLQAAKSRLNPVQRAPDTPVATPTAPSALVQDAGLSPIARSHDMYRD